MKKTLLQSFALCLILIFWNWDFAHADDCRFDGTWGESVTNIVEDCVKGTIVVNKDDVEVGWWANDIVLNFIQIVWSILSILAVLMLVYSGFLMTLSTGDDEKIKKGKDLFKWTLIWYIALLSAGAIVSLVISTIYEFGRNL